MEEYADLVGVLEMLHDANIVPRIPDFVGRKMAKKQKVRKFLEYSRERRTLTTASESPQGSPPSPQNSPTRT
jgi:hypothetical protein